MEHLKRSIRLIVTALIMSCLWSCSSEENNNKIGETYSYSHPRLSECAFYIKGAEFFERQTDVEVVNAVENAREDFLKDIDSFYLSDLSFPDSFEFLSEDKVRVSTIDGAGTLFDSSFDYISNDNGQLDIDMLSVKLFCIGDDLIWKFYVTRTQFRSNAYIGDLEDRLGDNIDDQMRLLSNEGVYKDAELGDFTLLCLGELVYELK